MVYSTETVYKKFSKYFEGDYLYFQLNILQH